MGEETGINIPEPGINEDPYQSNKLFFGILFLRQMSQEQSLIIRGRKRIFLLQTAVRGNETRDGWMGFLLVHRGTRLDRFFLQRGAQGDLELCQLIKRSYCRSTSGTTTKTSIEK